MHFGARALMAGSVVIGAVAVAVLALSVGTDSWLFTEETTEVEGKNDTAEHTISKHRARMGLWKVCRIFDEDRPVGLERQSPCISVDNIGPEEEAAENKGQETSFAIMRATRFAALFPVIALVLLTMAVILGVIGNLRQDVKTLLAAIIGILSGLSLAVGIILYISAINDEVGHRMKAKNGKQMFVYDYGWSFYFAGIAFVIAEATAVVYVTIFMHRHSSNEDMARIIPGLEDKLDTNTSEKESGGVSNPTIIL